MIILNPNQKRDGRSLSMKMKKNIIVIVPKKEGRK